MFCVDQRHIECNSELLFNLGLGVVDIVLPPHRSSIWCFAMQFVR